MGKRIQSEGTFFGKSEGKSEGTVLQMELLKEKKKKMVTKSVKNELETNVRLESISFLKLGHGVFAV